MRDWDEGVMGLLGEAADVVDEKLLSGLCGGGPGANSDDWEFDLGSSLFASPLESTRGKFFWISFNAISTFDRSTVSLPPFLLSVADLPVPILAPSFCSC